MSDVKKAGGAAVQKAVQKGLEKAGAKGAAAIVRKGVKAINPVEAIRELAMAYADYKKVEQQEQTKRTAIEAKEQVAIQTIENNKQVVLHYLDRHFDERAENFRRLFAELDSALASGNLAHSGPVLQAIVQLAEKSPFEALATGDAGVVLKDPDTTFEF